jgi:hypothetical protein
MRLRAYDIKFCRKNRPHPLVYSFYSLATKNAVLRKDLHEVAPELSLGPDLTK